MIIIIDAYNGGVRCLALRFFLRCFKKFFIGISKVAQVYAQQPNNVGFPGPWTVHGVSILSYQGLIFERLKERASSY